MLLVRDRTNAFNSIGSFSSKTSATSVRIWRSMVLPTFVHTFAWLHSWLAKNGDGDDIDEEALFLFRVSAPADD